MSLAENSVRESVGRFAHASLQAAHQRPWAHSNRHDLLRRCSLSAETMVAVSEGVADELAAISRIHRRRISGVYNPIVGPDILALAEELLEHPWFALESPPVIVAADRTAPQNGLRVPGG